MTPTGKMRSRSTIGLANIRRRPMKPSSKGERWQWTVMLINGGAAVAVLAFIGALVREGGVSVKQVAGVSTSLLWFGGGVAAAAWALALAYATNYCYGREEGSKLHTWQHPYIENGVTTPSWHRWGLYFHLGAIVWGALSLVAFIFGMIGVWNGIVRL
jgi:hypothetical protein